MAYTSKFTGEEIDEAVEIASSLFETESVTTNEYITYSFDNELFTQYDDGYYRNTNGGWTAGASSYKSYWFEKPDNISELYLINTLTSYDYFQIIIENPTGTFVKRVRTSDSNLPTEDNPLILNDGDVIFFSGTSFSRVELFMRTLITTPAKLNNDIALNNYQIEQACSPILENTGMPVNKDIDYSSYEDAMFTAYHGYYRGTNRTWTESSTYYSYYFEKPDNISKLYIVNNDTSGGYAYFQIVVESDSSVTRYRTSDSNLPTKDNPLTLNAGETVYISSPNIGTFELHMMTIVQEPALMSNNVLLNTTQIAQTGGTKGCYVIKPSSFSLSAITEGLRIYLPTGTGYIRHDFAHFYVESSQCDCWRLGEMSVVDNDRNLIMTCVTAGAEWEMAVHIADAVDFIGGYAHGDEVMDSISFFLDGKKVTPDDLTSLTSFNELRVIETSKGYNPDNTTEHALNHYKEYTFNEDGIKLNQKVVWLNDYDLKSGCYLAMCPPKKTTTKGDDTSFVLTNAYYSDLDYTENEIDITTTGFSKQFAGCKSMYVYGLDSGFSAHMAVDGYVGKSSGGYCLVTDNGSTSYNKIYFVTAQTDSVTANETWKHTTYWKFEYNELTT